MRYNESDLDKSIRKWFTNDYSKKMLRGIRLEKGRLRSFSSFSMDFNYPISAIAGKNGAGKSTLIAIACCAYHAPKNGYKLPKRNLPYYTFKDFFIQRPEENSANGEVSIRYHFASDTFTDKKKYPDGKGIGFQLRKKSAKGKWNDYNQRVHKSTVFLGIERIVPHSERSQSKSYSKAFSAIKETLQNSISSVIVLERV